MSQLIDSEIEKILWSDYKPEENFPDKRPLLAHYTSLGTLEKMMSNDEHWLSNPLNMNDIEELVFGINQGANEFRSNELLKKACGDENYFSLMSFFNFYYESYDEKHVFDTYVMCFSEYESGDNDGLLSMWRGYGEDGAGAAVVLIKLNLLL